MRLIDVSEFQGIIDYKKVKKDGIEGVIIRAGYGKGNVDGQFTRNITGAIKAGLHVGIYWFSYAYNEEMAKREARFCNDIIEPYRKDVDLPVFFDWEYDSMNYAKKNGVSPDRGLVTAMTKAFCKEIEEQRWTGGYYTNWDYSKNLYNMDELKEYKLWFADYEDEYKDCFLQQTSSTGQIKGIEGNVDTDVLRGSISENKPNPSPNPNKEEKPQNEAPSHVYNVGETYTVCVNSALNVRTGAGTNYPRVGYYGLTEDGKRHANSYGALLPNTRVTCLDTKKVGNEIWMQIPSGWVCADNDGVLYVK